MSLKAAEKDTAVPPQEAFVSIDDPRLAFITNKWSRTVVQPLLISVLMTALLSTVLVFAEIVTGMTWLPFSVFLFFVCLEGCYTTLWLQQPERRLLNHTAYRAAEVLLLALLLRVFAWTLTGSWPNLADIPEILRLPQTLFVDAPFIFIGILSLIAWDRTTRLSETFTKLSIDQAEVHYFSRPFNQRVSSDKPVRINRGEIALSFFQQWIGGALILAILTSISNFDVVEVYRGSSLALARLGLRPELLLFLLLYFLAGFSLLSQAQLAAMNARWLINGVTRRGKVERSWHRYTIWLLGGIALLAAFLPLGSTFAIGNLLHSIIWGISTAASFIMSLLATLLALILSLFSGDPTAETAEPLIQPTLPPVPTPTATPIPPALPPPTVDTGLIVSSLFWAVAIVISVMAVSFFLRERGIKVNTAVVQSFWQRLQHWLQTAWRGAGHQMRDLRQAVRTRWQREPKEDQSKPPWRFIRLNALSPREQIRYFYLSTVKRAGDKGVPRQRAETPLEFARDLKQSWPEAEEDVDVLTDAFLEARYGRSPIDKEDVNPVKKRWRQVKASLRRRSESSK